MPTKRDDPWTVAWRWTWQRDGTPEAAWVAARLAALVRAERRRAVRLAKREARACPKRIPCSDWISAAILGTGTTPRRKGHDHK